LARNRHPVRIGGCLLAISVLIMLLRKKLASQGVQIQTRNGVGYYMTFESKNRLRNIIEQQMRRQRISMLR
jgi:hypothetical protein